MKNMIFKAERFIKKIRWKVFFYGKWENTFETIVDNSGLNQL